MTMLYSECSELIRIFDVQKEIQRSIFKCKTYADLKSIVKVYNSATAAMVEIGEMLQENTTWKKCITQSKKEPHINEDKFLEEYCDVILYIMNVAIYAGFDIKDVVKKLSDKQKQNIMRFNND